MKVPGGRQLDDRRVAQFAAVVQSGSVRSGAEALEMDPSVISRSIARLEEEWGMVLLERKGRGIAVTEAGKLIYAYFQRHQALKQDLIAQTEAMATLNGGHVDVLCGLGYLKIMSLAVNKFMVKYPNIGFKVMTDSSTGAYKRILNDEFMIGLFFFKGLDSALLCHYSLSEPVSVIVRAGHPLTALDRTLKLIDLLDYNGYIVTPDYSIHQVISAAELHDGLSLNISINSSSIDILLAALVRTDGFTLLPVRGLQAWIRQGVLVELEVDNPILKQAENCIVSRRGRMLPPAAREFMKELISIYAGFDGDLTVQIESPTIYTGGSRPAVAK